MDPSLLSNNETSTSVLLPPIRERKVSSRRRRRPAQSVTAFPVIPVRSEYISPSTETQSVQTLDSTPCQGTVGADHLALASKLHLNDGTVSKQPVPSDVARAAFLAMPEQDIQEAQAEVLKQLDPSSVEFLKERWKQRGIGNYSNELFQASGLNKKETDESSLDFQDNTSTPPLVSKSVTFGCPTKTSDDVPDSMRDFKKPSGPLPAVLSSSVLSDRLKTHVPDIRDSLFVPNGPVDEKEGEKLMWTTDAETPVASQAEMDSVLHGIVLSLGSIANARFDLDGQMLSTEEIRSLPTHLGLHHHGTSPASAGYTLSDVLTLMRSTLVPQRVLALRILSAILRCHDTVVFKPLLESGALSLAFAPFPSLDSFFASVTNQIAYLDLVDVLIRPFRNVSCYELVPDLFFASRFYSPIRSFESPVSIFNDLGNTDCVLILIRIAFSNINSEHKKPVTLNALQIVRDLVISNDDACRKILNDVYCSSALRRLSVIPGESLPESLANIPALACDVIAQCIVRLTWDRDDLLVEVQKHFVPDSFLRDLSVHFYVFLRGNLPLSRKQILCAVGASRVMRAALTFQIGLMSVSTVIQPLTTLLHEDTSAVVEAYLLLEAYVHCLLEHLANGSKSKENEQASEAQKPLNIESLPDSFVMDQMSGLVPVAISSVKRFASSKEDNPAVKAAVGHFSATFLAIYRIPLDPSLLALILSTISRVTSELPRMKIQDANDLVPFRHVASVSHAGARLLTRVEMDPLYIKRELTLLLKAAEIEHHMVMTFKEQSMWRPVVNACVEWLGLLAKVESGRYCVELAISLVAWISDPQVLIDLLGRTVLRVELLCALSPSISIEQAEKSANVLFSATITGLNKDKEVCSSNQEKNGGNTFLADFSFFDVMKLWTRTTECLDSFVLVLSALFDNDLLKASDLFNFLLRVSPKFLNEPVLSEKIFTLLYKSGLASGRNGQRLILQKDETVLSMLSTNPNPELAVVILSLGAHLVNRGPVLVDPNEIDEGTDPLSSLVLSLIFSADMDVSLRTTLWKDTIDRCGGSVLFKHANLIGNGNKSIVEDEEMLRLYVGAIQNGFLFKRICSPMLHAMVAERLAECVCREPNGEFSDLLCLALQSSGSQAHNSFTLFLQFLDQNNAENLRRWRSQVQP